MEMKTSLRLEEDSGLGLEVDSDDLPETLKTELRLEDISDEEDDCDGDVLDCLNVDVWIRILGYLTQLELCEVGLVSKRFLELTRTPTLWSHISLVGDAVSSTECVLNLFKRCPF